MPNPNLTPTLTLTPTPTLTLTLTLTLALSRWATRSAVGAAKEAVERNETAPSELVKRLTTLAQEQILDAEVDPEGWGPAFAEQQKQKQQQQQQQQQQPGGAPKQKKRGKKNKPRKGTVHAEL